MNSDNFTSDQVDLSYALVFNTYTFFKELAEYIQSEQGKHDPLAIKLLETAEKLGKFTETDIIELLYHAKEMYNESNRNANPQRNQTVNNGA